MFSYRDIEIDVPARTRRNGTLFLHVILALDDGIVEWSQLQRDGPTIIQRIQLTEFVVPKAATFNLLGDSSPNGKEPVKSSVSVKTASHLKSKVFISILTDDISMARVDIPGELARLIK